MNLKLNRKQELILIQLGLGLLIDKTLSSLKVSSNGHGAEKKNSKKWSPKQRRKFMATMTKRWKASRSNLEKK